MNIEQPAKHTMNRTFKHLETIIKRLRQWRKIQTEREKEFLASIPLVNVKYVQVAEMGVLILEANRRGMLVDMIRAGTGLTLPEPEWITSTSYTYSTGSTVEINGKRKQLSLEEMIDATLSISGYLLPVGMAGRIISANFHIENATSHVDDEDIWVRIANVFIDPYLRHYQPHVGQLAKTTYMSEYGKGTRVFLRLPLKSPAL